MAPAALRVALIVAVSVAAVGCGSSGPATYPISGTVTFDGQPVADGEIVFRAADESGASWAGKITGGRYAIRSTAGNKRIEITATREVRMGPPAASGEPAVNFEMYIPDRYNSQSELSAHITAAGEKEFDFDLQP